MGAGGLVNDAFDRRRPQPLDRGVMAGAIVPITPVHAVRQAAYVQMSLEMSTPMVDSLIFSVSHACHPGEVPRFPFRP